MTRSSQIILMVALCWLSTSLSQQANPPRLILDNLPEDLRFVGDVALTARVEPATQIRSVTFVVQGDRRCHLTQAEFTCTLNLPPRAEGWQISVTATLVDGRVVTRSFRAVALSTSSSVEAVTLPIVVMDERRRPIRNLGRELFLVLNNGVRQPLDVCTFEETALDVVLLVDISTEMRRMLPEFQSTLADFLTGFERKIAVTLLAFNREFFVVGSRISDPATLREAVSRLTTSTGSGLYDALFFGMEHLGSSQGIVPALVVFTDGNDTGSRATLQGLHAKLETVQGSVYMILRETQRTTDRMLDGLKRFTETSGGQLHLMENTRDLRQYLEQIQAELTSIYLCSFTPAHEPDDTFHGLSVEVIGRPDAVVRHRAGYFSRVR